MGASLSRRQYVYVYSRKMLGSEVQILARIQMFALRSIWATMQKDPKGGVRKDMGKADKHTWSMRCRWDKMRWIITQTRPVYSNKKYSLCSDSDIAGIPLIKPILWGVWSSP